jgi:hypothetical protein
MRGADAVDAAAFCARRDCRAGWRKACERSTASGREMLQRTAKSCGPDASTPASSPAEVKSALPGADKPYPLDDGDKKARSPGRARRKPLKPLRAGMPGDSGVLVVTRVRSSTTSAHEAAGALGTRRSPRPLLGGRFLARLGRIARRGREIASGVPRHCERSEAIHSFFTRQDGLLRGACHRARIRATRWLAMTVHN